MENGVLYTENFLFTNKILEYYWGFSPELFTNKYGINLHVVYTVWSKKRVPTNSWR